MLLKLCVATHWHYAICRLVLCKKLTVQAHISCSNYIYKVNCTLHRMRRIEVQLYRSLTSAGPRHVSALYPRERDLMFHEAGWASGPAWTGAESLEHIGIRIPNRPAHGESLRSMCDRFSNVTDWSSYVLLWCHRRRALRAGTACSVVSWQQDWEPLTCVKVCLVFC